MSLVPLISVALFLLVQDGSSIPDVFGILSEAVLGIVVILMILGYLWAKPAVDALTKENERLAKVVDRKDEELSSLRRSIEDNVIPSIEKNAHVAERVVSMLDENRDTAKRLVSVLDRIEGQ